jgi:endonuclease/exonuclease/phosphatase family metal-dependent hydrolase
MALEEVMTLRILSYNILAGGQERLPLITRVIQKQQADVVALVEANSRSNAEALAHQLEMGLTFGEANGKAHVAWLSRLPVIRSENHRLPIFAKTLLQIEILWEGAPLALFATHLKSGQDQKGEQQRLAEMQAILGILNPLRDQPHVLVGDLNTIHPTDSSNAAEYLATLRERGDDLPDLQFPRQDIPLLLKAEYVDCYRALHPMTPGYTSHTTHPALRVDYIFVSLSLARRLSGCDIVMEGEAGLASDHFPIWAEFR